MEKAQKLKKIANQVKNCQRCPLYKGTNPVAGTGNPHAKIMFLGEAPGFHEDRLGLPFVGAAGKLLDKALAAINIKREDVFIGNMIKHRPPNNRDPFPKELEACNSFIDEQIKIIDPKLIATLGRFSMGKFLKDVKISQVHGQPRWVEMFSKRLLIMPLYHPAAALRRGVIMNQFIADIKKIPQIFKLLNETDQPTDKSIPKKAKDIQLSLL